MVGRSTLLARAGGDGIEGQHELANDLADVYTNKANALSVLRDTLATVALYDQAIAIWYRLVK